jgi:hypothetical protein
VSPGTQVAIGAEDAISRQSRLWMRKEPSMTGIHHVTAISGKATRNLDFYTHVLGLRFVKKTVNFDEFADLVGVN